MKVLVERFPTCFAKPTPLKVNIHRDIWAVAQDLDRHDVINALGLYCTSDSYKAVLVEGAARVDLEGRPSGEVTKDHVKRGIKQLQKAGKWTEHA